MVICENEECKENVDGVFICPACGCCVNCCSDYAKYLRGDTEETKCTRAEKEATRLLGILHSRET